jgi:hypothetical protein
MRYPARKGRADSNQKAIADAIRLLGFPVMDLHAAGNGVEDLLVGIKRWVPVTHMREVECFWVVIECKVPKNKRGEATPCQFKPAQKEWYAKTQGFPRIIATSAQDAVNQIRALTASPTPNSPSVPCSVAPRTMPGGQRR